MKHIILTMILLLFIGCNKNRIEQRVDKDGYLVEKHFADNVFYYYKLFYPSGKLAYEVSIANNLPNGAEIEYYEDGSVMTKGTRANNLKTGFYYYYGINKQLDSIVEYVPLFSNVYLEALFHNSNNKNISARNRHIIYKDGEINYEKSLYFEVSLKQDTVLLGDSITGCVDFVNQSNNQPNKYIMYVLANRNDRKAHGLDSPIEIPTILCFNFIPKTKGRQILEGIIDEHLPTGEIKHWFFEKQYFVK